MLDRIRRVPGRMLDRETYNAQMAVETARLTGVTWKLERSQWVTESERDPAWRAFVAGRWSESLAVFDGERDDARTEAEKYRRQGSELRRLRIVESPVSPYVQWEMHALKVLDECGIPVGVLDATQVEHLETERPLPELVVVGQQVVFEVRYDASWSADGARRIDDTAVIEAASAQIAELWRQAEPLADYFDRVIAPLAPPSPPVVGA